MKNKKIKALIIVTLLLIGTVGSVYAATRCNPCGGTGSLACGVCRGTGRNSVYRDRYVPCQTCNGRGTVICYLCGGDGWR